ncbi:glutamate ABC transporter substrate-binding protein [Aeromicrobium sp.]|uniref:glutamate ABC transporter substrate-binding protein n=1 Tax=Aeromicrobium sp. TaxID=1871063 RepID=UPI003D6AA3B9
MKFRTARWAAVAAAAVLTVSACGDAGEEGGDAAAANEYEVVDSPELEGRAAELAEAGKIKIGVKFDQPGIGFKGATDDVPTGFDPEMGKIIAGQLGLEPDAIEWVEAISDNREPFLQQGTVDLVIASYSITDERRQIVGQAGPYYVTGQQLLVAADDDSIAGPDDLKGKKVCSVTGSTSIATVEEEYGADPAGFDTYSECVDQLTNGSVDAVTTDGAILLGYAAEDPDALKVVGEPFSEERYGIGYSADSPEMCEFLNGAIENAFENGDWKKAFDATLSEGGGEAGEPPAVDPCE